MLPTMSGEATVVADPELRFSAAGKAWAKVRLVSNDRVRDANGTWTDGDAFFFGLVVFGRMAENLAESVLKGDRVHYSGRAKWNEWETADGQPRRDIDVTADWVAPSLTFDAAKSDRMRGEVRPRGERDGSVGAAAPAQSDEPPW